MEALDKSEQPGQGATGRGGSSVPEMRPQADGKYQTVRLSPENAEKLRAILEKIDGNPEAYKDYCWEMTD